MNLFILAWLFTGRDCENDTDGCAATPCALGRTCVDIKAEDEAVLGRGYNCSDCPPGYKIVDEKCEGKKWSIRPLKFKLSRIQFDYFFLEYT